MTLRKITINNRIYFWKREHIHLPRYDTSPCVEKITVYLDTNKKSPLRLFFKEDDNKLIRENFEFKKWHLHNGGDGVAWKETSPTTDVISINFNRPAVIKDIIIYFLNNGWNPENSTRPLEINDALKYLNIISFVKE